MIATKRRRKTETAVLEDELPPLQAGEIRLRVDKVGLTTNNVFYAQMGDAPFLKFFSVYPLAQDSYVNVPAWGIATIIASNNIDFKTGERFRGFLHITNVVQMKAKKTSEGFTAYGNGRDKLTKAYNKFVKIDNSATSPLMGNSPKADVAMAAAPSALSGFIIYELLKAEDFFQADSVVITSASAKISLAVAVCLQRERHTGKIRKLIGYTSKRNLEFVQSTHLYDDVLTYDQDISSGEAPRHMMIDIAGDAQIIKRNKKACVKVLAVGATHANAKKSTFATFGLTAYLKMGSDMIAPKFISNWLDKKLNPAIELFFAPTVMTKLISKMGRTTFNKKSDQALADFASAMIDNGWMSIQRCEDTESIQAAYTRIFEGNGSPSQAVVVSLSLPE